LTDDPHEITNLAYDPTYNTVRTMLFTQMKSKIVQQDMTTFDMTWINPIGLSLFSYLLVVSNANIEEQVQDSIVASLGLSNNFDSTMLLQNLTEQVKTISISILKHIL
jgi:hypothetical protein